jgi:hypothetical protein
MAVTYRSSVSTNTGAAAAASLQLNLPAGIQVNDILIAAFSVDGGTASTTTPPSGWTILQSVTQGTNTRLSVYYRIVTGYEAANYTWTFDVARFASGSIVAYSGASIYAPVAFASALTASASTTVTGAGPNSTYEIGRGLQICATRNTTAVTTLTSTGSFAKREETSTTATTFMGVMVQDTGKGLPIGGLANNNCTSTQSVTGLCWSVFIEEARPSFAILGEDEFICGSQTTPVTTTNTALLQTNVPNCLILAFIMINKDVATVSSITGGGLTWVLVGRSNANAGSTEIWRAFAAAPLPPTSLLITYSQSVTSLNQIFAAIQGADIAGANGSGAIGSFVTGSTTAAAASIGVTTTSDNSWVWAAASMGNAAPGTITPGSNQTILRSQTDSANAAGSWMWRQNALTPTTGTVVTMNCSAPTTGNCNIAAVEVLPAIRKPNASLGVG